MSMNDGDKLFRGEVEHDWYSSLEPATAEKLKAILIKPQRLCSNSGNTLGEGYFGKIYLGRLKSDDDESEDDQTGTSQVAVKVLKGKHCQVEETCVLNPFLS